MLQISFKGMLQVFRPYFLPDLAALGHGGELVRDSACLPDPPMWPGFNSNIESYVAWAWAPRDFLRVLHGSPLLKIKTYISKFQFDLGAEGHRFLTH